MKLSKQELKKIMQEELEEAIKEGELDEAFLDRLFGRSKSSRDFVSSEEVDDLITSAINSVSELVRTASRQENMRLADEAARIKRDLMSLSALSTPRGSSELPEPEDFIGIPRKPPRISSRRIGETLKRSVKK